MSESALIVIEGFQNMDFGGEITGNIQLALIRALNRTADKSRTRAAKAVLDQVNFPASYVSPANKRLWVKSRANKNALEAVIEGRSAATSLARFSSQKVQSSGKRHAGGAVNIEVKPGRKHSIKRAFLINLSNNNIGLAVRTNGNAPAGAYKPKELGKNLWLLYGPSVDQALIAASRDGGVYEQMTPEMLDFLEAEFNRQMDLLEKI